MRRTMTNFAAALLLATTAAGTAVAEKPGGILRIPFVTSPASMSIHEESTIAALGPMMGVFNNLVMFDQHVPQKQPLLDRARSGGELELQRGRQVADVQIAPGRQMA